MSPPGSPTAADCRGASTCVLWGSELSPFALRVEVLLRFGYGRLPMFGVDSFADVTYMFPDASDLRSAREGLPR